MDIVTEVGGCVFVVAGVWVNVYSNGEGGCVYVVLEESVSLPFFISLRLFCLTCFHSHFAGNSLYVYPVLQDSVSNCS